MGEEVNTCGIITKRNKPEALSLAREIAEWLLAKGIKVLVEKEVAKRIYISGSVSVSPDRYGPR